MKIRPTGILIEDGKILLLEQALGFQSGRKYSLPGGTLEENESIADCLRREMQEETGLDTEVVKLLYVCDRINNEMHILHMTFLVKRVGGELREVGTSMDIRKIHSAKMVPLDRLHEYGFSERFCKLANDGFPDSGTYQGDISNIGL